MSGRLFQPLRYDGTVRIRRWAGLLLSLAVVLWPAPGAAAAAEKGLRQSAVVEAVRRVNPIVVNISSEYEIRTRSNPFGMHGMDRFFDSFFNDFFEPGFERRANEAAPDLGQARHLPGGDRIIPAVEINPHFPYTLDLRRGTG